MMMGTVSRMRMRITMGMASQTRVGFVLCHCQIAHHVYSTDDPDDDGDGLLDGEEDDDGDGVVNAKDADDDNDGRFEIF